MLQNMSEVAHLKQAITEEYEAGQRAMKDLAMVGRHDFMIAKTQRIGEHFERLSTVVGSKEQAVKIVAETLAHVGEEKHVTL